MKRLFSVALLFVTLYLSGCSMTGSSPETLGKVKFDISKLDNQGMYGQPDGLRALSYEFCIPDNIDNVTEVLSIDPSVVVYQQSPGRIGCSDTEYLCIGNTAMDNYREVLYNLIKLKYVKEIQEAFFE